MKDLNLNELLRYFIVGVFVVMLLYFLSDRATIEEHLNLVGKGDAFGIFSFLSLTIGAVIYVFYRAFIHPILINPTIVYFMKSKYKKELPGTKNLTILGIISYVDLKRWKIENENIRKSLSEWASQVHFLYNLSLGCLCALIWVYNAENLKTLGSGFVILLFVSILHHYRYKSMEINAIKD